MTLYEYTENYKTLLELLELAEDEDAIQAYTDTLEAVEGEINEKIENIGILCKNLAAEVEAMKAERDNLTKKIISHNKKIEKLKEYTLKQLDEMGLKKAGGHKALFTVRVSQGLDVDDEKKLIEWCEDNAYDCLTYAPPKISKTRITEAIKAGKNIPYCAITSRRGGYFK